MENLIKLWREFELETKEQRKVPLEVADDENAYLKANFSDFVDWLEKKPTEKAGEKIEPGVNIRQAGRGYLIDVKDEHTNGIFSMNSLAVTREELEKIVLYGREILDDTK